MKKIIYISSILLVTFISSCEVESGEGGYPKTLQGKVAYDIVTGRLYQSLHLLDLMTKVDYYGQAPADEKEGIKNYFLPNYTIIKIGNAWILKNDSQEIVFSHNQKSLNEKGAVWTTEVSVKSWDGQMEAIIKDENFYVESLGDKNWKATASDLKFYNFASSYNYSTGNVSNSELFIQGVKAYNKSPNLYDFNVDRGTGNMNSGSDQFNFQVSQPISYTYAFPYYSTLSPISGELGITANKDKISVKINTSGIDVSINEITDTYYNTYY